MQKTLKPFFFKTLILLISVLACMPCFIKRDIKQSLNIPVTATEHFYSSNKAGICSIDLKKRAENNIASSVKQKFQNTNAGDPGTVNYRLSTGKPTILLSAQQPNSLVAIYILHGQFLI